MDTGALVCHVADVRKEYVEEYVWPALKANAIYEDKYLLGTSTARPLIAKVLVDYARKEGCVAVAHGATGKGNDQVRFDLGILALAPDLEIIAPWRTWDLKSREDEIAYLEKRGIPVPMKKSDSYSRDDNLWHISHEGLDLEDPANEPTLEGMLKMTTPPEKAPDKAEYVELDFESGIPVALNGKKMDGVSLILELNKIGGKHGVGLVDLVENRMRLPAAPSSTTPIRSSSTCAWTARPTSISRAHPRKWPSSSTAAFGSPLCARRSRPLWIRLKRP
jgi:argininosuccinate synthase